MDNTLKKVNEIYSKENPSTYLKGFKKLKELIKNREYLLLNLKLPKKIFINSKLVDFGSGTGLNTIAYSIFGAECTLVEYDKKSVEASKKLFKRFSKSKFRIIKSDIFKANLKKKFDFVVSNGVAHHTKNPKLNLKICINSIKKNGFLILGIGETNGFFQRNLQRYILYSISNDKAEIIKLAKKFFKEHLGRSSLYTGRSINQIIYDTYLNPKINTLSLYEIIKFFKDNNLDVYSFYGSMKKVDDFFQTNNTDQFKILNNQIKRQEIFKKNLLLHDIENFSLSTNNKNKINENIFTQVNSINLVLNQITESVNDIEFQSKLPKINLKKIDNLRHKISKLKKIDIIDKNHNLNFIDDLKILIKLLRAKKNKKTKIKEISLFLLNSKNLLKGLNGTGMNYIVGYKK